MFDLQKDIDKYQGIPPYASELYGVYQPLLGWQSELTKGWLQHHAELTDPRVRAILDAHIRPGPTAVRGEPDELRVMPLEPGSGHGAQPYSVSLRKDLHSELLEVYRRKVTTFVNAHEGNLPEAGQWTSVIDFNELMGDSDDNLLGQVQRLHRNRVLTRYQHNHPDFPANSALVEAAQQELLDVMQYESQIATFLLFHAESQAGNDPELLRALFQVRAAPPLSEILRPSDPLAEIDPKDRRSGALSPVGFVHLFRQYYFNLGTFLGEPVEHVWLAPGTTIELIEISTRTELVERTLEQAMETAARTERASSVKDEISEAAKQANENSTKLGVSQTHSANLYVYQGTATVDLDIESTRTSTRETAYTQNREQSESLSNEIKQSFKSVFRTVSETTDTTSRRHVIENRLDKLVNYELRRKMRRVGVQVQDIGMRMCWQVFVDDPGRDLGLADLVHIAKPADLKPPPNQNEVPYPSDIAKPFEVEAVWQAGARHKDDVKGYIPLATLPLPFEIDTGFEVAEPDAMVPVHVKSYGGRDFQGPPWAMVARLIAGQHLEVGVVPPPKGSISWNRNVTFVLVGSVKLVPTADVKKQIDDANKKVRNDGKAATREEQRRTKEAFHKAARERIELAAGVRSRPSWDLREEERTVVYRKLLSRLMLDSWKVSEDEEHQRLSHVRSEIIRTLFDVDSMLYFVAPEWWQPREHYTQFLGKQRIGGETIVNWSDGERRADNYFITEKSQPAKLGSSLGWLLQLDGDNLRNAFLNAPWVKAVVPVRPGREKAALNWLRSVEGEDGWDAEYLGTEPEFAGKELGEVLKIVAERIEAENGAIENTLKADAVFEKGFDHLAGGFDAGLAQNEVFSQWISVLPTDQIAAVEYEPTDLVAPD